jgi:hypothetical protein
VTLDEKMASRVARIALGHVAREYPNKPEHVLDSDADVLRPRELHPLFYGSFDWHSCVHGWWTLLTLRRLVPGMAEAAEIAELAGDSFTTEKVAAELAYLDRPNRRTFERPYGWAWLLYLHLEATRHPESWAAKLEPLAHAFAQRLRGFLPVLTYPIRSGAHFNTAFALVLALDWADRFDADLGAAIRARASGWFESDRDCPAWEPSGDDFVSPSLTEALCMARNLAPADFERWFDAFLPRLANREPATLFTPVTVSDRSDGKIAHLDGLNLSRAWCWRSLAPLLPPDDQAVAMAAADQHLQAALPHVAGDYMGEHWLATFALLALLAD